MGVVREYEDFGEYNHPYWKIKRRITFTNSRNKRRLKGIKKGGLI